MKWFCPCLLIVFTVELVQYYLHYIYNFSPYYIYNSYVPLLHLFYVFIFYKFATIKTNKAVILTGAGIFSIVYFFYLFTVGYRDIPMGIILVYSSLFLVLNACLFLYEYLMHDGPTENNRWSSGLWIAVGVIIFYCGIVISYSLRSYSIAHQVMLHGKLLHVTLPRYLCMVLYLCLSISFFKWKGHPKSS
ncbi:hypothetical protein [Hufsiella ginkgonis]|uniref:Uncharacterized protein n=1 Tax=Hufsiella ginkgonis TaxID=2695274 RepID=A0A7K1XT73_9SPHI|nr:hypothetical protein [Hufsiella ginkgonis]MXV14205.1 hypothetical protein [Hufsiella ginkgonis]